MQGYQSPIILQQDNTISIKQCMSTKGKNRGALYNQISKIFEVKDKIILRINSKLYQLDEYHFHINGEHKINGQIYPSEIHYVFIELGTKKHFDKNHTCSNICGGVSSDDGDILVIGRVINFQQYPVNENISKVQVNLPHGYYEYDGSLTTGTFSPVRWIVGEDPMYFNMDDLQPYSKTARPLQPLDGRIILFSSN